MCVCVSERERERERERDCVSVREWVYIKTNRDYTINTFLSSMYSSTLYDKGKFVWPCSIVYLLDWVIYRYCSKCLRNKIVKEETGCHKNKQISWIFAVM